ncbi:MAG TPA: MG2 domain-containing protein [Blastocatellia bacterium]|nr:MG2 domain-containing protein [Blastocatellia bacterium]
MLALLCAVGLLTTHAQKTEYATLKSEAEKQYINASYAKARELYLSARALNLAPAESRWVAFRLADTLWRSQAATNTADSSKYDEARQQLEVLVRDITRAEDRDLVWVEVQESLGDFWWMRNDSRNWGQGWQNYQQALDWWSGSADINTARDRYLKIVWKISKPSWSEASYYYGYYGNYVPLEILDNALKIAQIENDRARLHYLVAMTLRAQGGDWDRRQRVPEEFEAAIKPGKATDWHDDALYYYGEWMSNAGRITPLADGQWKQEPDYVKAVELFRRLISEYQKGETRYYDQAKSQIENITKPAVGVGASNVFLPDSEIQFYLSWRNVKRVELALYKVDLPRDVRFSDRNDHSGNWVQRIDTARAERVKAWAKDTEDKGDYRPGSEMIRLDGKLAIGAYLLEARSGAVSARDLILVSDTSLVLKTSGRQALAFFCNALTGAPVAEANVKLWEHSYNGNEYVWREQIKNTGVDGIAVFDLARTNNNADVFAAASSGGRQAFANGHSYRYQSEEQQWRIYAFTDRPAYRPGESAQWKFLARRYADGVYSTPANQKIEFEITDPRGTKIKAGKADLNAFGSATGSVDLTEAMPLGEYNVSFWDDGRHNGIGNAVLFRLEEYKLPEFKVSVTTPEEDGKKKAFRLGEKVEVNVQADYYFGGAVSNATVELLVYQNPFYHYWYQPRDYEWYYEDLAPQYRNYGRGQIIKRETLKTDATGKAMLEFETPRGSGQDFEYLVEARVTDSSRREIAGTNTVRVTRQRYYVYPRPKHYIYRPQDKVSIDIKAMDANSQPVQTEGRIKVTRDYWYEIWLDPTGREIKGDELKRLRESGKSFPPAVAQGTSPWRLKFQGYEHDEVLSQLAKTNAQGEAELSFTPEREGYYRIAWTSDDKGSPIKAETAVWVATGRSTDLGYRYGGLEVIVDKDTFRSGQKAPVMLVAPTNDRYVLFSVEGEDLYSYQLVHLDGNVKLIELQVEDKHVPNIFLSASMVSDRQIFTDTKQVVVPPVEHFLSVELKPDREEYQPREQGLMTVTTRDADGKPVAAEVALAMVDESVFYIQKDYGGDPRQFYYGRKRQQIVQTTSTFQLKQYVKLVEDTNKQLVDDRVAGNKDQRKEEYKNWLSGDVQYTVQGRAAAAPGVSVDGAQRADAVSESVTVTRSGENEFRSKKAVALPVNGREFDSLSKLEGGGKDPAVQVRNDFRSTALWEPNVLTDKFGKATVKLKFPDSLTGWTATARVASATNQFGIATAAARTKQPLIVRLQAPRFFTVGDSVTVSAVINNNTGATMTVSPSIAAEGVTVTGLVQDGRPVKGEAGPVAVQPNSEARVDWLVAVQQPGAAKLKVTARGTKYADAMEKSFVVYEHGIEKLISKSGKLRGDDVTIRLDIPAERKRESTSLTVQIAPSMAVTMLDALPYLIDYPYGCTEQTMSRFLPAAITRKTLKDLGLKPENIMGRIFGGIEPATATQTHTKAAQDLRKLDDMTRHGLDRLYNFQHSDGGWGWWKEGESDHFMTAYVVWGLVLARDAGIEIDAERLNRGANFLDKEIVEEEANYDQQAWMIHALAVFHRASGKTQVAEFQAKAFDNLWANRDRLNAYTRALLALSAHSFGFSDKAKTLVENLENGVKLDSAPDTSVIQRGTVSSQDSVIGTAHWGEDGIYWRWSDGGVEATSFALRAFLAIDPKNKLVEPVTNWLIKNRRGSQWSNTRDTAITVLALNDYLRQSGELAADIQYELSVNGKPIATRTLSGEDALSAPSRFAIDRQFIRDGVNEIRIARKRGSTALYFSTSAEFFSLEEPIAAAGNEIFVRREYFKLVGKPTLLKGYVYERQPLNDGQSVTSGDRVEVVITVEAKNNYEYLLFEDLKPAGLEAVQIRSGEALFAQELKSGAVTRKFGGGASGIMAANASMQIERSSSKIRRPVPVSDNVDYTGRTRWVYQELRDRKVAMFIDKLPEGVWQIRYDLRAETPGTFHALPILGQAMYVPEIRSNGTEVRITVDDKK